MKLPRQVVTIAVLVVLDDGSSLCATLNAAVAALLDAAIPLNIIAVSAIGQVSPSASAYITYDAHHNKFLAAESHGTMNLDELERALSLAEGGCQEQYDALFELSKTSPSSDERT